MKQKKKNRYCCRRGRGNGYWVFMNSGNVALWLELPTNDRSLIWRPGQTDPTCWCNIIQHCWIQNVALVWPPCCPMLNDVGWCWTKFDFHQTSSSTSSNISFVLRCEQNVALIWPPCLTLLNARMPAELTLRDLLPWLWFTVYTYAWIFENRVSKDKD